MTHFECVQQTARFYQEYGLEASEGDFQQSGHLADGDHSCLLHSKRNHRHLTGQQGGPLHQQESIWHAHRRPGKDQYQDRQAVQESVEDPSVAPFTQLFLAVQRRLLRGDSGTLSRPDQAYHQFELVVRGASEGQPV